VSSSVKNADGTDNLPGSMHTVYTTSNGFLTCKVCISNVPGLINYIDYAAYVMKLITSKNRSTDPKL